MSVVNYIKAIQGVFGDVEATGVQDTKDLISDASWVQSMALDAAAGTDTVYFSIKVPINVQILEVIIAPGAALTAADATANTYTLAKADGAGGGATTVASVVTNVAGGSWVADVFKTVTLSATFANLLVSAGQILTFKKTHAGAGTVSPASSCCIRYRKV
jgi:hypothetical protein